LLLWLWESQKAGQGNCPQLFERSSLAKWSVRSNQLSPRKSSTLLLAAVDVLGLQVLEVGDGNERDECVELVRRVLILVTTTRQTDADAIRNAPDSLGPDLLVQSGVDTNVVRSHLLLGELADLLDRSRCAFLEADAMDSSMEVNCVFTGDDFMQRRPRPLVLPLITFLRHHLNVNTAVKGFEILSSQV